jgi:hypothetical protein
MVVNHIFEYRKELGVPIHVSKFIWDNVPGSDDIKLLLSLEQAFDLEEAVLKNARIQKIDSNVLKIIGLAAEITVKLDLKRETAVAELDNSKRKFEYRAKQYNSNNIFISAIESYEDQATWEFNKRNLIEMLVYNLISRWGNIGNTEDNSQDLKVFSEDKCFIQLVDNMHDKFEYGHAKFMKAVKS